MPTYRIRSGDLHHKIKTEHPADAFALCIMALAQGGKPGSRLGKIVEVKGGEYRGDQVMYIGTQSLMEDMGMLPAGV